MLLHGIYDNGKITLKEKELPHIKTEIIIEIPVTDNQNQEKFNFKEYELCGIWKDRQDIQDSVEYTSGLRKKWSRFSNGND